MWCTRGGVTYIYIQNWIIVELPRPPPFWGKYRRNEKKNNEIKTEIEGKGILCTQVCTMVPAGCTGFILPTDSFKEYGNNKYIIKIEAICYKYIFLSPTFTECELFCNLLRRKYSTYCRLCVCGFVCVLIYNYV